MVVWRSSQYIGDRREEGVGIHVRNEKKVGKKLVLCGPKLSRNSPVIAMNKKWPIFCRASEENHLDTFLDFLSFSFCVLWFLFYDRSEIC